MSESARIRYSRWPYFILAVLRDYSKLPLHFSGKARRVHSPVATSLLLTFLLLVAIVLLAQAIVSTNGAPSGRWSDWYAIKLLGVNEAFAFLVTVFGVVVTRQQYVTAKRPNLVFHVRKQQAEVQLEPNGPPEFRTAILISAQGFSRIKRTLFMIGPVIGQSADGSMGLLLDFYTAKAKLNDFCTLANGSARLDRFVDGVVLKEDREYPLFEIKESAEAEVYICFRFIVEGELGDVFYRDYVFDCKKNIVPAPR